MREDGSSALLTDHYELTMLQGALHSGAAARRSVFEMFARRLPEGRRYGVVAGTGRFLDLLERFRFGREELDFLSDHGVVDEPTLEWLADYRFSGNVWGYGEGEAYFPGSPILVVESTFADAVILETLALSVYNHDSAIASAASRMSVAAGDRPLIEMGSRRTHEQAAVASARAAYVAGFATSSNLEAGRSFGVPTGGTAAHAFTLLHDSEQHAFKAQLESMGKGTTLLVDTYDVERAVGHSVELAGKELGAVRIDSGDLAATASRVRAQLDGLGATDTRIVVTGDLDEHAIQALAVAPVDGYGVGTSLVTGSGARPCRWCTSWWPGRAAWRRTPRWNRSPSVRWASRAGAVASGRCAGWTTRASRWPRRCTRTTRARSSARGRCSDPWSSTGRSWGGRRSTTHANAIGRPWPSCLNRRCECPGATPRCRRSSTEPQDPIRSWKRGAGHDEGTHRGGRTERLL